MTVLLAAQSSTAGVQGWVSVFVGVSILLAFVAGIARFLYKIMRLLGPDDDGHSLRDRVRNVEQALNNGLRSDVRAMKDGIDLARSDAASARTLAAEAAHTAAEADRKATEGRDDITRAVNALRSEVEIYTNVVMTDRQRIKEAIRELGGDLPDDE